VETVAVALITALATLGGVWLRGRQEHRARWHADQRAIVATLLRTYDDAIAAMSDLDAEADAAGDRVAAFEVQYHKAELLVPSELLSRARALGVGLRIVRETQLTARLSRAIRERSDRPFDIERDEEDRVRWRTATKKAADYRRELVDAARKHFGF
jgi:hypothetical protein